MTKPIGQLILEQRQHFFSEHQDHPEQPPLPPVDPQDEARRVLRDQAILGATPVAWMEVADPHRLLSLEAPASTGGHDLVAETLRVNALVGVSVGPADVLAMRAQADALPAPLRAAFADLVAATADAYATQALLATSVMGRIGPLDAAAPTMTLEERDATIANAESFLAAQNRFRLAVEQMPDSPTFSVTFSDPEGLVVLGGLADNTWTRGGLVADPVLVVELGGNDTYTNSAGGACPVNVAGLTGIFCNSLALSAVLDLAGNDQYTYSGPPSVIQGAGAFGGVGILVDVLGADRYTSTFTRALQGPIFQYVDGVHQGASEAGYGLLLDGQGNDVYRADVSSSNGRDVWDFGQGFGSAGGLGIAADGGGNDQWLSNGLGLTGPGFQGVYTDGVGFYAGVGLMYDAGSGDDVYTATNVAQTVDYYAQGFGAFGGLGLFVDDGGNDSYSATQVATNPWIVPLLNCAFGSGSLGGIGIFLELGGRDTYYGDSTSPFAAETMNEGMGDIVAGYGLFVDLRGDDGHFMYAHGGPGSATAGRGVLFAGGANKNIAGTYLDLAGLDQYVGAPPSRDSGAASSAVWLGGADVNGPLFMNLEDFLNGA